MTIRSTLILAGLFLAASTPAWAQGADASITPYSPAFFAQYRPATAFDMVSHLPGFQLSAASQVRGYAGNAGNVLIDGDRPPSMSDDLAAVLNRIPAASVERIELVRGGAGGIDMHGQVLIANIIRRKQATARTSGSVNGQVNYDGFGKGALIGSVQAQRSRGDRSLDGSLNLAWLQYGVESYTVRRSPSGAVLQQGEKTGAGGQVPPAATVAFETPWAGGKLRMNGQLGLSRNYYGAINQLVIPGGQEIIEDHDETWSGEFGLRYSHPLPHGFSAEIVGLQQLSSGPFSSRYDTPTFTSGTLGDSRIRQSVASATLTFPRRGAWSAEAGTELAFNRRADDTAFSFNGSSFALAGDAAVVEELRTETFVTATWRPTDKFSVQAGARYERSTITASGTAGSGEQALSYLKPRLNLTWTPDQRSEVSLKIERVVDQLSFSGFAAAASFNTGILSIGNPELRPTNAWTFQGRYERRFWDKGSVSLTALHKALDDVQSSTVVTVPDPLGGPAATYDIASNVGRGRIDELTLATTLPLDRLGLKGGEFSGRYLWRQSSLHDPVTLVDRPFNLAPASWTVSLSQQAPNSPYSWTVTAVGQGSATLRTPRAINVNNPPSRINAAVSYEPRRGLKWTVGVDGLNATGFLSEYTLFNAPRNVGSPVYVESYRSRGVWISYLALRKTF